MFWLLLGVLIWSVVHWFPALMPAKRAEFFARWGGGYMGGYALVIVLSVILMIVGWRSSIPETVYNPPTWGRHLTMLLMLVALILAGASHGNSRIRQYVRHPLLTSVAVWAVAHLLANGDSRSVLLFGSFLIWSLSSQFFINRRDGVWVKPAVAPLNSDLKVIGIGVVVYLVLMFLHPYFTGVSLFAR